MNDPKRTGFAVAAALALAAAGGAASQTDREPAYALVNARVMPVSAPIIESGTVVLRGGLIAAVGAGIAPPDGAVVIDLTGRTIYPGLIDLGSGLGLETDAGPPPSFASHRDAERWKRHALLKPTAVAADRLKPDAGDLARLASAGITSVLSVPQGGIVAGQSSLINTIAAPEATQIGDIPGPRPAVQVVRSPVALHVSLPSRSPGLGYPSSLLGSIAFARQAWLDAAHQRLVLDDYRASPRGRARPPEDLELTALAAAMARGLPVVFSASSEREIRRALAFASEFSLDPVISGAREAAAVAPDLKRLGARVILSVNYPGPFRDPYYGTEETLAALRARAEAPKVAGTLAKEGLRFGFTSAGLDAARFLQNIRKAVASGLSPDDALRALTLDAAMIAGAHQQLGSIEPGKIANLVVARGDLFSQDAVVTHVFVDGRPVRIAGETPGRTGPGAPAAQGTTTIGHQGARR